MLSDLKFSKRIVGQVFGPAQYLGLPQDEQVLFESRQECLLYRKQ